MAIASDRFGFDKYANDVSIAGTVNEKICYSHEAHNKKFYSGQIGVCRLSGVVDDVPVTFGEEIIQSPTFASELIGKRVCVTGSVRTRSASELEFPKLKVYLFADRLYVLDRSDCSDNTVSICGAICQKPVYRQTPQGREICELKIAVARPSSRKSDYIPCIAWGDNARAGAVLEIGTHVTAKGRFQSRDYMKRLQDGQEILRTAYEISLFSISTI